MRRLIIVCIIFILVLCSLPAVSAAGISARLNGPATIRSGETIALNLNLNGTNLKVVQGAITFDAGQLEYKGSDGILSGWKVDVSRSGGKLTIFAEDDKLKAPINGSKKLCTIKFLVKASAGKTVTVSTSNIAATDGNSDFSAGNTSYSATVAAPPSGNRNLKTLQVKNATITPAFSAGTTSYQADVPFEVTKLDIAAVAEDAKASVNINSPNLVQNAATNVVITVTAENGSKKSYTIKVKRARDPNYVESANNNLSSLGIDKGALSPAFSADITSYSVSVPYEVDKLGVTANAADKLAKVSIGNTELQAGAATGINITVTAENGSTKTYTIQATRASYVPGTNNALSGITLDKSMLSPAFGSDVTRYIVWLPYEADSLDVKGIPVDEKAKIEVHGGNNLEPGKDNEIKIICTSEDGKTKEYIVIARRALPEGETVDNSAPVDNVEKTNGISVWIVVLAAVLCAAGGFGAGFLVLTRKRRQISYTASKLKTE